MVYVDEKRNGKMVKGGRERRCDQREEGVRFFVKDKGRGVFV